MAACYLLQMVPGHTGSLMHEWTGIALAVLFVVHHLANRGWLCRLRRGGVRTRILLASDVVLLLCVIGLAACGVLMSRSALPMLARASIAHLVRPMHACLTYLGLLLVAFHAGLHARTIRGYLLRARIGVARELPEWLPVVATVVAVALGTWALVRLDVGLKLTLGLSFPDGVTPLPLLLIEHLALAAPAYALGAWVMQTSSHPEQKPWSSLKIKMGTKGGV